MRITRYDSWALAIYLFTSCGTWRNEIGNFVSRRSQEKTFICAQKDDKSIRMFPSYLNVYHRAVSVSLPLLKLSSSGSSPPPSWIPPELLSGFLPFADLCFLHLPICLVSAVLRLLKYLLYSLHRNTCDVCWFVFKSLTSYWLIELVFSTMKLLCINAFFFRLQQWLVSLLWKGKFSFSVCIVGYYLLLSEL